MQQRRFIFNGGNSTRFHTVDVHTRQDIGNHSFGVAWLCELLTGGNASKMLIMAALAHDLAEHRVGDIPSPAKRALGISKMFDEFEGAQLEEGGVAHYDKSLTSIERTILKFADMMEGMTFCIRERKFGNRNLDIVFDRFRSYVFELMSQQQITFPMEPVWITLNNIVEEWNEVTNDQSQRAPSGGAALQGNISTLGLGEQRTATILTRSGNQVLDKMEEEERVTGLRKSQALS